MPRCNECNRYTNFTKRGVKIYKQDDIVEWLCFTCQPLVRFKPNMSMSKVRGLTRKDIVI